MKQFLLTMLCCYFSTFALAQSASQTITVKGVVIDSVSKLPVSYVTVALQDAKTKIPVKSILTKDDGSFEIKAAAWRKYQLVLVFIGYKTKVLPVIGKGVINMGKIKLQTSNNQLAEVSITTTKPVIKQEVDRISYDVQADPDSKILNVLDMLRKVPLVSLDADDNIKLKGNSSYKILINGRPSSLVAHNPSDVFRAMPASSIQRIEVITNPPSKYDAEGLAGIINIITNKKIDNGYNGNLNVSYSTPAAGPREGGSLTVKEGKFGASTYFGTSNYNRPVTMSSSDRTTTGIDPSDLTQSGLVSSKYNASYVGSEFSYEIDSLNLITADMNFNWGQSSSLSNRTSSTTSLQAPDTVLQGFNLNNAAQAHNLGVDLSLNYQLGFKHNKDQLLTFSYQYNTYNSYGFNNLHTTDRVYYPYADYTQANTSQTIEQTMQADYVQPFKKLSLEGGNSNFQYDTLNPITHNYDLSPSESNIYHNFQYILGAYNSYTYNLNKWSFKAGGRLEETIVSADFLPSDEHYLNLIPYISVNEKLADLSNINFGYTQRIQRPDIFSLNPFVNRSNPDFQSTGNPNLRPVLSNNLQFNYSKFKKSSINIGLSYSFANNTIQGISIYNPITKITTSTIQNIGKNHTIGTNFYFNYPVNKNWYINFSGNLNYLFLQGIIDTAVQKNHGLQGYLYASTSYKLNNGWRLNANYSFNSPYISLQSKSNSYSYSSFGVSRDVVKNKLTFSASVTNPLTKYREYISETTGPDFTQTGYYQSYYRSFNVSLNYRFGKLTSEVKKSKRNINNDDTSKSSGN
jgi:hypothetical protein